VGVNGAAAKLLWAAVGVNGAAAKLLWAAVGGST
jgi:hypothetical protein